MKLKAYAVYDDKAATFAQPFFVPTRGLAVRSFEASAQDSQSALNKWPGDFKLFEIGEYDDQTAFFEAKKPEFVIAAVDVLQGGSNVVHMTEEERKVARG